MKRVLIALLVFGLCMGIYPWAKAQSFGSVRAETFISTQGTSVVAGEATNADLVLDADDGDDNADTWTIRSTASGNALSFINHTTSVMSLATTGNLTVLGTFAGVTSASVVGIEAGDASVIIDADEGDDNADTWTLRSTATGNALDILNHTTAVVSISSTGAVSGAELSLTGVTGSGKAVCVKADGALGVCGDAVGGGGTCTCS